jgi:hypothetical protein
MGASSKVFLSKASLLLDHVIVTRLLAIARHALCGVTGNHLKPYTVLSLRALNLGFVL